MRSGMLRAFAVLDEVAAIDSETPEAGRQNKRAWRG